jgi:DNA invertase Pin-like site-specific DNA recombinase
MPDGRFVAYYRVSTAAQGRSGLGLAAQREAVRTFLNGGNWSLLGEHTEVESGKIADRPELARALHTCRLTGAALIIAKLDRLSRDAAFLLNLEKAGIEFVAADMPNANRLTVRLMAVIAQEEREMIAVRTKAALAAAKARGKRLGGWRETLSDGRPNGYTPDHTAGTKALQARADAFAATVGPMVVEMRQAGRSLRQIAASLSEKGIRTPRGGAWTADAVSRVLLRTGAGCVALPCHTPCP